MTREEAQKEITKADQLIAELDDAIVSCYIQLNALRKKTRECEKKRMEIKRNQSRLIADFDTFKKALTKLNNLYNHAN